MVNSQQFFQALEKFEASAIPAPHAFDDTASLCVTYDKVRPIIEGLLPFIKAIPGIGPRIGSAISALIAGLDAICPQPSITPAVGSIAITYGAGHEAFFEALRTYQGTAGGTLASAEAPAGITMTEICALYKHIKPILEGMLEVIALLPGYGKTAAMAIRALMTLLDGLCP